MADLNMQTVLTLNVNSMNKYYLMNSILKKIVQEYNKSINVKLLTNTFKK